VSAMMFIGPWHDRVIAGAVGGLVAWFGTPLFSPLVQKGFVWLYTQSGVDPSLIPVESVPGVTGLLLGVSGIHLVVWFVERLKSALSLLKFPGGKTKE